MRRHVVWLLIVLAGVTAGAWGKGYEVYDLGEQSTFFGSLWRPLRINEAGTVVGTCPSGLSTFTAYTWTVEGGMTLIPTAGEMNWCGGLNTGGVVCGTDAVEYDTRPWVWAGGAATYLTTTWDRPCGEAKAINTAGRVVGLVDDPWRPNSSRAALWSNGGLTLIPVLRAGDMFNVATAINDNGEVVGYSGTGEAVWAFAWDGVAVVELAPPGADVEAAAADINSAGQAAGTSWDTSGRAQAWLWQAGQTTALTSEGTQSWASGLNDAGVVVGGYEVADGTMACVWNGGEAASLASLTEGDAQLAGWRFDDAHDVNSEGWIVGVGRNPAGEEWRGFLLVPVEGEETVAAEVTFEPGRVNLEGGARWLTASVVLGEGHTAQEIDGTSVRLAGMISPAWTEIDAETGALLAKFAMGALEGLLTEGVVELEVTGELTAGGTFAATGTVEGFTAGQSSGKGQGKGRDNAPGQQKEQKGKDGAPGQQKEKSQGSGKPGLTVKKK